MSAYGTIGAEGRTWRLSGQARWRRSGFSLIEVAVATVVIGIGLVAVMQLVGTASQSTRANTELVLALQYARAGWETAYAQGFDVVQTWTANPPTAAPAYFQPSQGYQRRMWVENVSLDSVTGTAAAGAITDMLRLNVAIYKDNSLIYSQRWILTKP